MPLARSTVDSWPHRAQTIDVDGAPIAYHDVGSGPTVLMVHMGLWSFVWRDLIHHLSTLSLFCVRFAGHRPERNRRVAAKPRPCSKIRSGPGSGTQASRVRTRSR